ncbi:MAG TPA: hypothetical protein VEU31_05585 [Candidatus Acidoferrales bacterium]|nr:hypothetical protein [Candidatus Acidoferrales bacterium]
MKFAKVVFWVAGIWGVLVITPLYFLFDTIGRNDPPAITHPGFFYGFVGAALVWQIAYMLIATDPGRFRPLMIVAVLAKFSYGLPVVVLVLQKRMHTTDLVFGGTDLLLGVLFAVAYVMTPKRVA